MPQNLEHSGTSWKGQSLKHADSVVDQLDARVRVLCVVAFALLVVLSPSFSVAIVALVLGLSAVYVAKLNIKRTLRRVIAMDLFMVFLIVILPFTTPGEAIFSVAGVSASWEGLRHALLIAAKANAVVLSLLALVGTMSASQFGHALSRLRVPDKLVHLLLFTVRYLDVIGQEYKRMRRAMQARAFVMQANRHTWRSIGYMIGMLLVRALERSERVMNAMKCRGYQGRFFLMDDARLGRFDLVFVICSIPMLGGLAALNFV